MPSDEYYRVLVINYEYPPVGGGGGFICCNFMEELAALGHSITVITSRFNGLPEYERRNGVDIYRVPVLMRTKQDVASLPSLLSFVPSCIRKVRWLMRTRRFDVISTHFAVPSGPAGQYISNKYGLPNVLSIYGGDIYDPSKFLSPHKTFGLKQTVRKMLTAADRVISDSSDIEQYTRKYYGVKRDIEVIPPGVRPYAGPVRDREALGLPKDKLILTTLGRLVKRKNNEELLGIFSEVRKYRPCHLLVMGEGPDRPLLEKINNELDLTKCVTLAGRVGPEKFQYLASSDIYVSTASHEGFGLAFLEAMESGLPIICYDNGGQVDFLENGKTGFLVKLGQKENFCRQLRELLTSPKLRKEMSAHNRKHVKQFYVRNGAERHLSIFRQAMNR